MNENPSTEPDNARQNAEGHDNFSPKPESTEDLPDYTAGQIISSSDSVVMTKPTTRLDKRLLITLCCVAAAVIIIAAAVFGVLYFKPFMNPEERTLENLMSDLKGRNYDTAYKNCLSDTYKSGTSLDEFKKQVSSLTFFNGITSKTTTNKDGKYEVVYSSLVKGKPQRTYMLVKGFDKNGRIDFFDILEIDVANYGETVDTFSSNNAGDYVFVVGFKSTTDYSANNDFSSISLMKDGKQLAQPGVIQSINSEEQGKMYQIYFSVPQAEINSSLSFSFKDYPPISLEGLVAVAPKSTSETGN